ncbi:kinase-like domain-containing protein [Aspergillus pseudotamarii]|uniref:non-specific serine/threonine protein kinase n=1 Tax=Aspergillus pseudotamarii TaxID=132259 RepID=A0A5N6SRI4_ASPPS|nr:kinase-like domain-containing protein [Aspergillus pseudotamarii]KAE8137298.1 kinase-like domain-containing protein [Aspergillus pseudotamarii]
MQRAAQSAWTLCIPRAHRCFTTFLPSTSCRQRISLQCSPRTTVVPHRTVMSSSQWTCAPRTFPTTGLELLDESTELDEETLPTYQPEKYYPVNQGEVLNDRYQILAKIGYGVTSTVWLAKDLVASIYVVVKIYITGQSRNHERELHIYKHMDMVETKHPGRNFLRKLLDHFYIQGPHGRHVCLVHEPLGTSADVLVKMSPGHVMTLDDMKPGIRQLLIALDFLHSECHIIHTDLQLKNLLLPGPEISYLSRFEEAEITDPSPRKILKERTIYQTLNFLPRGGLPVLADFGEARLGDIDHTDDIMPNVYRAPEVILRSSWSYKVDIWNVAMVAWDIVSPRTLIDGKNANGIFDDRVHMAELVALLGPPPPEFREQRHLSSVFWDESGRWKEVVPIPDITLESLADKVEGEDKAGFLQWLRTALQWNPEDRPTALELLYDEWLMKGLGD